MYRIGEHVNVRYNRRCYVHIVNLLFAEPMEQGVSFIKSLYINAYICTMFYARSMYVPRTAHARSTRVPCSFYARSMDVPCTSHAKCTFHIDYGRADGRTNERTDKMVPVPTSLRLEFQPRRGWFCTYICPCVIPCVCVSVCHSS